jgi:hypothetical protein
MLLAVLYCCWCAEEGRVDELQQLVSSGVVRSLKVVDGEGHHVMNIAVKHKQDKVVQVGGWWVGADPGVGVWVCWVGMGEQVCAGGFVLTVGWGWQSSCVRF